jgi:hypothetical protein
MSRSIRVRAATAVAGLALSLGFAMPPAQAIDQCTHSSSFSAGLWTNTTIKFLYAQGWQYKGSILVHVHWVEKTDEQWIVGVQSVTKYRVYCAK